MASLTAVTNLPEGTLVEVKVDVGGGIGNGACCPPVKKGKITVTADNSFCYGSVGHGANSPGFEVKITARPDLYLLAVPGGGTALHEQPRSVLDVLGQHFENLTGDQVVQQPDGSKWLVGEAHYRWPTPQCGGDQRD